MRLHMPTHIFTRLGHWKKSVELNRRSADAAWRQPVGGNVSLHFLHAYDYMVHAHLQMAEDEAAKAIYEDLKKIDQPLQPHAASAYALASIPARIAVANRQWKEAANLDVMNRETFPWEKFPQFEALLYFAKGVGAGRSANPAVAKAAFEKMERLQETLGESPATKYWYNQMEIQKTAVKAWMQFAEGNTTEALANLQLAADMENKTEKSPITPGEIVQVRELLGDMYMELDDPKNALTAYEAALENSPNRFNVLYGAGKSAELTGEKEKAKMFFSKLMELEGESASEKRELAYAKKVVKG